MRLYKYKVKIPDKKRKGKLIEIIFTFTTKDLQTLFDYYGVPYKEVE